MSGARVALDFLQDIWTPTPGAYAALMYKDETGFHQRIVKADAPLRSKEVYLNEGRDLYFCPHLFSKPERKERSAIPGRWLYADLDERDPRELLYRPTVWWETSPNRFQGLWFLERGISLKSYKALNRQLNYFVGADKAGWALTKVLRVPGSVSTKHGFDFHIEPEDEGVEYDPKELWARVKHVPAGIVVAGKLDFERTKQARELMRDVPVKLRVLLRKRAPEGKRSDVIWAAIRSLHERGFDHSQILTLMMTSPTVQDKYGSRMQQNLERDIAKAVGQEPELKPELKKKTRAAKAAMNGRFEDLTQLLSRDIRQPSWLAEGAWSEEAHGFIFGAHKTFKSLVAMDFAVSVASGTKFLDYFEVPKSGHVLYIQEENQEAFVKDRFQKILVSRELAPRATIVGRTIHYRKPADVPITVMNNKGFDLTSEDDLDDLRRLVDAKNTALVVLDPLYLMTPGVDENSAAAMTPVLENLLRIKHELGCGVLLIHHYKKQNRDVPFYMDDDRASGTGVLNRWWESAMLIEKGNEPGEIEMVTKHRMNPESEVFKVLFQMGEMGDMYYEPVVTRKKDEVAELYDQIKKMVREQPGVTVAAVARATGLSNPRTKRLLADGPFNLKPQAGGSHKVFLSKN